MATLVQGLKTATLALRVPFKLSTVSLILLTAVVGLLTITPIVVALLTAFRTAPLGHEGQWTLEGFVRLLDDPSVSSTIWTSTWLSIVRALLATGLAIVIAWILARSDCPCRNRLEFLFVLSFFFPGLGKLLAWVMLASEQTGYLNLLIRLLPGFNQLATGPLNVYSYGGVIFVSVLAWSTILVVFLLPAFRNMDASLEESARMSGATTWKTLTRVTAPLMRPAIAAVFVLALVRMFSSFDIELFLGTPVGIQVFTTKIYERLVDITPADYAAAFVLVFVLLLITFTLVVMNWLVIGKRDYTTVSGRSYSARPMRLGKLRWVAFGFVALYLLLSLVLPLIVLVQTSFMKLVGFNPLLATSYSVKHWETVLSLEIPRQSIMNTLVLALTSATIGMTIYSLVAYVVVRTKFAGARFLDLAAWMPWGVPLLVLGLGVLWTIGFTPLSVLYGTLPILVLAHVIRGFPSETRIMTSTMIQIGPELEESARVHGASWPQMFWRVMLPLVKNGYVTGWIIAFVVAFYDLALVVFLFGPQSMVLPTLFLSLWRSGQVEKASVAAIIMTAMILLVVTLVRRFTRVGLSVAPR